MEFLAGASRYTFYPGQGSPATLADDANVHDADDRATSPMWEVDVMDRDQGCMEVDVMDLDQGQTTTMVTIFLQLQTV